VFDYDLRGLFCNVDVKNFDVRVSLIGGGGVCLGLLVAFRSGLILLELCGDAFPCVGYGRLLISILSLEGISCR
jgi:hypothetical protein